MNTLTFQHTQTAHCESGVTSNLFQNGGIPLSEAMAFGIGSGIFFVYLPFVKVMGIPLTSYRSFPGGIFKKTCHRLGIPFEYRTFRDPLEGNRALDGYLSNQQSVGLRTNIFWLPYIPERFRFQFNGHNLVVYGKNEDGTYLVSDPVLETTSLCPARSMTKARFAKGVLAPRGLIFFPRVQRALLQDLPLALAIRKGIKETVHRMLYAPFPFFGVKGIRYLSRQIRKWPRTIPDVATRRLYLANVVRMQEEIGTGGAGFRYLYAAFLQESGELLKNPVLLQAADKMTQAGNLWREFATLSAAFCKGRLETPFDEIPNLLLRIAELEKEIYLDLRRRYL